MKILVVDDEDLVRELVTDAMAARGYKVKSAASGHEAIRIAETERDFDLVVCDVAMDGLNGFDVLKQFRERLKSNADIVLMTGQASVDAAIQAVQSGASDYLCKPFTIAAIQEVAAGVEKRRYPSNLIEADDRKQTQDEILGSSAVMIDVVKSATRVAATDLPVLICGESGTGKELVARLIHRSSARSRGPFVPVNCGALPDTLLESELFGHTRGAFTGADANRRGLFEEANGGTLLLDEVTETSPAFQVKLLRTLQEGEVRSLGSNQRKRVDVRVLSATNRNPLEMVEAGLFRQDLLYRLQGVSLHLPSLRERREDIRTLVLSLLSNYKSNGRRLAVTGEAMMALERYDWPGNVRELKHLMQRLAALTTGVIRLEDLPSEVVSRRNVDSLLEECLKNQSTLPTLEELESSYLLRVLSAVNGNKTQAAQILGVDRKTLYRMIEKQGPVKETTDATAKYAPEISSS
jgi:DNA-binding NtrC family response regulator